jgi:hypothetical protein
MLPTEQPKTGSRDFFLEVYRTYNRYHNEKETLVWLAANTYLASMGVVTGWLLTHLDLWANTGCPRRWILGIALGLIGAASTYFAYRQNQLKAQSVVTSNEMNNMLCTFGTKEEPGFSEIKKAILAGNNLCPQQKRRISWCNGLPGWALVILMALLGFALILLVACYPSVVPCRA